MCTCDLQLIPNQRDKQSFTSKYSEQKYKISKAPQKILQKRIKFACFITICIIAAKCVNIPL